MVVLKNITESKEITESLTDLIPQVSEDVTVIIVEPQLDKRTVFYKALKKHTDFKEFVDLPERQLTDWISEQVSEQKGTISSSDATLLAQYCAGDQTRLEHEIQKLVAYEPKISKETIELLVEKTPQDTIFQLLEQALGRNVTAALNTLKELERAHEDPFQIASMLIWQTHILTVVWSSGTHADGEVAKDHKINPYVVSKTRRLASRMDQPTIRRVVDRVAEMDVTLKSNSGDHWRVLERTVIALK